MSRLRRCARSSRRVISPRLETDRRKITAEELIVLAVALETTPNRLLLGDGTGSIGPRAELRDMPGLDYLVRVTDKWTITLRETWLWAQGEELPSESTSPTNMIHVTELQAAEDFRIRSNPTRNFSSMTMEEQSRLLESGVFDGLEETERRLKELGYSIEDLRSQVELRWTMEQLGRTVRESRRDDGSAS